MELENQNIANLKIVFIFVNLDEERIRVIQI